MNDETKSDWLLKFHNASMEYFSVMDELKYCKDLHDKYKFEIICEMSNKLRNVLYEYQDLICKRLKQE